jgi:predicted glycogen debranching enzyme
MFFWAVSELDSIYKKEVLWKKYGPAMKKILTNYNGGTRFNIHMQENGLIYAKYEGVALTWMDAYINGKPVTQRGGLAVEVNAAWYYAVCYAIELAEAAEDTAFLEKWSALPELIAKSFIETFWDDEKGYLADYVDGDFKDWSVRPNMIFATYLDRSPLSREQKKMIVSKVKKELLTPKGLRTLSPKNPAYKGVCEGDEVKRSAAAHQGCVYPFLIAPFIKSYLSIHKAGGLSFVKDIMEGFKEEMTEHCIGTISEIYDGNPPHSARGAISQAMNVGAILSAIAFLDSNEG